MTTDDGAPGRAVEIRTADGRTLTGRLHAPERPSAVMAINPATGYVQGFYSAFAQTAARYGWAALTFDYRGQGASRTGPVSDDPSTMMEWARYDIPAAAAHVCSLYPGLPLDVVGHSVGGQFAGLIDASLPLRRLALLSSSSGYWGLQRAPLKYAAWAFWRLAGPAWIGSRGYIPKGLFWKGEDLPAGVWRDWRDFGVNPECFRDALALNGLASRYRDFRAPIRAWIPDDDPIANPDSVRWLLELYESAPSEMKIVRRSDLARGPIGHDGLFRRKMADVFWPQVFHWLTADDRRMAAE